MCVHMKGSHVCDLHAAVRDQLSVNQSVFWRYSVKQDDFITYHKF